MRLGAHYGRKAERSDANNRNMTPEEQRTGVSTLFLRYLFASLHYFAHSVHAPSRNLQELYANRK